MVFNPWLLIPMQDEEEYDTVFVEDEDYTGSPYHSLPCMKHGVYYVPPGWKMEVVKRREAE